MARGGRWLPLVDGAGGRWPVFVGSAGGRWSPLVAGAGACAWVVVACAWVVVAVLGCWCWVAVVRWRPLSMRMVVAGRSWVAGVLVRVGIPRLVRRCRYPVVCHIGGNDVAPGTEQ